MKATTKRTTQFRVGFDGSSHWVNVVLHPSRRSLNRARQGVMLAGVKGQRGVRVAAFTVQHHLVETGCVAEMHLAADGITYDDIAHEAFHAALHRAKRIGIPESDDRFEELGATDAGIITDAIVSALNRMKVRIKTET